MGSKEKTRKKSKLYFNSHEYNQIIGIIYRDPYTAASLWEDYIDKYPKDSRAKVYYASTLIVIRELDKAEELLNEVEHELYYGNNIHNTGLYSTQDRFIDEKVRLLIRQGKYEELCSKYFVKPENMKIDTYNASDYIYPRTRLLGFYCAYITNRLPDDYPLASYTKKQIADYSDQRFLEHIKKHTTENEEDEDENGLPIRSFFVPEIDMEKLWIETKKYIPSEIGLYRDALATTYIFKYDQCGYWRGKLVDYFIVNVILDTDHFITMCPSYECENLPCVDLNYLKNDIEEKEPSKVKQKNQIERFNQRYGIN